MDFCYTFPVVRGLQAGREYYIAMVPLKMLPRLFPNDDEYVLPEYRAQRKLNVSRIPEIKNYIVENRNDYVFSALAASIDGEFEYHQSEKNENLGTLDVSLDARFLINDGQHRKAAILEAIREDETLGNETISIVFYADQGLKRSQQLFTDLNKHAVKTSNSISELYDSRDALAVITRDIVTRIDFLNSYTDKEKDILGKYSSNLFTLSAFYNANKRALGRLKLTETVEKKLFSYWNEVCENIVPWLELTDRQISKVDLRENYIVTQSVFIQVLGRLGNHYIKNEEQLTKLNELKLVNWRRDFTDWQNRLINQNGRIINNEEAIILACNYLKQKLGIELDSVEIKKEKSFIGAR